VSRHFDDLDAVLEFDALDDFRQLIFALQSSPCFCGGVDEFEHGHRPPGLNRTLARDISFAISEEPTEQNSGSRMDGLGGLNPSADRR